MGIINQGELLRIKRKRAGMNQEYFAAKTGISLSSIRRYEDSVEIRKKALSQICTRMKWDINEFYESTPAQPSEASEIIKLKNELLELHRKYNELREKYEALENTLKKSEGSLAVKIKPVTKKTITQ